MQTFKTWENATHQEDYSMAIRRIILRVWTAFLSQDSH
uniref:Macaca fascicularis brain cDNA clone: QmoA-12408, similar to human carcinoembryonic antigen-related cell adhesion molecule7 (CEACAM7), mRNA, RefSeq: NM_006890.1 n=1 Tax=Macaca fascicularis TaxID=9541 RepID=I7GJ74_MACFA|nr:unnamed protein product [Macaca fascicularis]